MVRSIVRFTLFAIALPLLSMGQVARAQSTCAPGSPQLIIFHAGSLTAAFSPLERLFTQQTGICVTDVAAGSVDAARQVTTGGKACDIYASADYADIDLFLKPTGYASYNIIFAQGGMVLAYTTNSKNAGTIAPANSTFSPPAFVPPAAADWYSQLTQTGVNIAGSHPFLDPSGYRADMIFQLAEQHYSVPDLYDTLLSHYSISKASDALGKTYDYQLIYEHSAFAAYNADATKMYRYVRLPDDLNLANPAYQREYETASVLMPGLRAPGTPARVLVPATRVMWGLTIMDGAPHPGNAVKFLQLLFGSQGVAQQTATGPAPISPPIVSRSDYARVPVSLQSLVTVRSLRHDGHDD